MAIILLMRRIKRQRIINIVLIIVAMALYITNTMYIHIDNYVFGVMLIFMVLGISKIYRHIFFLTLFLLKGVVSNLNLRQPL